MLAVQGLCDTPAFLAAYMGAGSRLGFLRLGRGGGILRHAFRRVAIRAVFMGAACHKGITVLGMFMGTGDFRCPLGVAAAFVVLRVMFAQGALRRWQPAVRLPLGKGRGREQRKQQAHTQQRCEKPFFHVTASSCSKNVPSAVSQWTQLTRADSPWMLPVTSPAWIYCPSPL